MLMILQNNLLYLQPSPAGHAAPAQPGIGQGEQALMRFKGILVAWLALVVAPVRAPAAEADPPDARQAQAALQKAEDAVRRAWAERALWTTAQEAVEQARAAAARGDYGAAVQAAGVALEQAELGIAQSKYPRFQN